ncbi:unnamed protein product [Fraxinus pennsylvanica]|uniref:Uncharacterized protein n=1 Tax=Fraxinus pennsylvanica TaxID=56036 RepID=A0AAD1YSR0_9LAMI|nr:unnamed protein product [Fraxinus pennsylvanica]
MCRRSNRNCNLRIHFSTASPFPPSSLLFTPPHPTPANLGNQNYSVQVHFSMTEAPHLAPLWGSPCRPSHSELSPPSTYSRRIWLCHTRMPKNQDTQKGSSSWSDGDGGAAASTTKKEMVEARQG